MLGLMRTSQPETIMLITALHALHTARSSHDKAVRPFVCLSNARFVTKRKKLVPTFLHHFTIVWRHNKNG